MKNQLILHIFLSFIIPLALRATTDIPSNPQSECLPEESGQIIHRLPRKPLTTNTQDHGQQRDAAITQKIQTACNQEPLNADLIKQIGKNLPLEIEVLIETLQNKTIKVHWPHFVLLVGEPGVGKSTFGKYIAQVLEWPYFFISAATIADEYQHSGAQNIERLINEILIIAQEQPCIVIFDEINALTDKGDQKMHIDASTSMAFWTALDRCQKQKNIVVIGTTNDLEKQRDQIASRAGCHIITIKPAHDNEYAFNMLLCYLAHEELAMSRLSLRTLSHKFKKLNPRAIEQIVNRAAQLANSRNSSRVIISKDDLLNALSDYKKAQDTRNTWTKTAKSGLKKFNKYGIPLISAAVSITALIMFWPQLKTTLMNLHILPKQAEATQQQLDMNPLQRKSLEQSAEIYPLQKTSLEQSVKHAPRQAEIAEEGLKLQKEGIKYQKWAFWTGLATSAISFFKP